MLSPQSAMSSFPLRTFIQRPGVGGLAGKGTGEPGKENVKNLQKMPSFSYIVSFSIAPVGDVGASYALSKGR